jgi:hypothetical protein
MQLYKVYKRKMLPVLTKALTADTEPLVEVQHMFLVHGVLICSTSLRRNLVLECLVLGTLGLKLALSSTSQYLLHKENTQKFYTLL